MWWSVGCCFAPQLRVRLLALALDANAHTIVTGDQDLLVMHPYRGVAICPPTQFLDTR